MKDKERKGTNMATYKYTAMDCKGREKKGLIHGKSESDAVRELKEDGLFPTSIKEEKSYDPTDILFSCNSKKEGFDPKSNDKDEYDPNKTLENISPIDGRTIRKNDQIATINRKINIMYGLWAISALAGIIPWAILCDVPYKLPAVIIQLLGIAIIIYSSNQVVKLLGMPNDR